MNTYCKFIELYFSVCACVRAMLVKSSTTTTTTTTTTITTKKIMNYEHSFIRLLRLNFLIYLINDMNTRGKNNIINFKMNRSLFFIFCSN